VGRSFDSLSRKLEGSVITEPRALELAARDRSHVAGRCDAVVVPRNADDIATLAVWARQHRMPLVARGAGTSLDGESVPVRGGIVVDLSRWTRVIEVDPEEGWARVEPGVVNLELQEALARRGVFFPPNPGSWTSCTIGGNVGTNASGPRSFRYGPTRAWVRGVELVLGTGERARWGSRAHKRSVGPDLVSMFVGSEGTLGIATEIMVRTAPMPAVRCGLSVALPDRIALGPVAVALAGAPSTGLSAIEHLDRRCAAELRGPDALGLDGERELLLLEVEADSERESASRIRRVGEILRAAGVDAAPVRFEDADALWSVRGQASVVLDRRFGERIREDVAVPLGEVDRMRRAIERIATAAGVPVYLFGHLGEGTLHPNFVVPPASPAADRIRERLFDAALRLGGTISSEHGIGAVKARYLERELGRPGIDVLEALKRACDPSGILNPGKLYPSTVGPRSSPSPSGGEARAAARGSPSDGRGRRARGRSARSSPRRRAVRP
jgi:FAD/FMN-containing dehydrogenase